MDAALFSDADDWFYIFKGGEFVKLDWMCLTDHQNGYPKPISGNFAIPETWAKTGVDAALFSKKDSAIFFFKGGDYTKLKDGEKMGSVDGYPRKIRGNW